MLSRRPQGDPGRAPLGSLAEAAGFRIEMTGDVPLLRYVRAVRP